MSWDDYVFEDPMESYERCQEDSHYWQDRPFRSSFAPDPLYYFTEVSYTNISKTKKAYQLNIEGQNMWVPKGLLKQWTNATVFIHTDFYENKLYELDEDEFECV